MKLVLSLLLSIQLYAAGSGVYVELSGDLGLNDTIEVKNGTYVYDKEYAGSISLGYQADLLRFELEAMQKKDRLYSFEAVSATGDLEQTSQMLNLYYSGYNKSKLVTTVGIGAGVTSLNLKDDTKDKNILSYQGMFSVGYMSTQSLTITTEYTYFYMQESDNFKSNSDNIFSLNFRYLFN